MSSRRPYPERIRLQAIAVHRLTGSPVFAAEIVGVGRNAVSDWSRRARNQRCGDLPVFESPLHWLVSEFAAWVLAETGFDLMDRGVPHPTRRGLKDSDCRALSRIREQTWMSDQMFDHLSTVLGLSAHWPDAPAPFYRRGSFERRMPTDWADHDWGDERVARLILGAPTSVSDGIVGNVPQAEIPLSQAA